MLKSPSYVTIGASNLERTARFLQAFGFVREADRRIDAFPAHEVYGLTGGASETRLTMPGTALGFVRLVETSEEAVEGGPTDWGPHAIDLYVSDMTLALEVMKNTHAAIGPVAAYSVGPMTIKECKCVGPDGLAIVLFEVDKRRPSVLDSNAHALFSEVHAGVYVVDSTDAAAGFWKSAGLKVLLDATFAEPAVARLMHLPSPDAKLRLALFADEGQLPVRLELISFPEPFGRLAAQINALPLKPGRFLFGFTVDDVSKCVAGLPDASFSKVCRIGTNAVASGMAPGGVGFELSSS